jgi:uncharacterized OB-fold protein
MNQNITKPLPNISDFNRPFWQGAHLHEFRLQKCNDCHKEWAPSGPVCPHCFSTNYSWINASGKGKVASWVVFHKLYHPSFELDIPYNVVFVELDEGPRIIANVIETPNKEIYIGMPLEVVFEDINQEISIPRFRKAKT